MSEVIFTFEDGSQAMAHYGVMGMKWGVRKDRERTEQKVRKYVDTRRDKAAKLRARAMRKDSTIFGKSKTAKRDRYLAKEAKFERKANRRFASQASREKNAAKAAKYRVKAGKYADATAKVSKLNAKAERLEYKADRMERAYNKAIAKLDAKTVDAGKRATEQAIRRG